MTSMLPWPKEFLLSADWLKTGRLLDRLVAAARRASLPGTLLIVGDPGLGREAVAVELAAALVCRSGTPRRCTCAACERVRRGVHPDVAVVDVLPGKSDVTIAQTRELVATIARLPYEGAQRAVVLASVETPPLNAEAASALLKTLEEPPTHVTLILLAANPDRVLPTIVSRSVVVRVPSPTEDELAGLVASVQDVPIDEARVIVRNGLDASLAVKVASEESAAKQRGAALVSRELLGGDTLALLRLAAMTRQAPDIPAVAVRELVEVACQGDSQLAEASLDAAVLLLQASRRQAVLHTESEGTVAGALAPWFVGLRRQR